MKAIALHNPLRRGAEVVLLQELLTKRGFYNGGADGVYGPHTADAVLAAKTAYHWPHEELIPVAGDVLMHALETGESPYHSLPIHHSRTHTREEEIRSAIVKYADWANEHRRDIHYAEVRPMELLSELYQLPWTGDCSTFVTRCFKAAGAPDPNGSGYNGYGYTGTLLNHMRHITKAQLKPGDVVVYGAYPGHHTALVIEPGNDPMTISHGNENGPYKITVSEEAHYQPAGISWLTGF